MPVNTIPKVLKQFCNENKDISMLKFRNTEGSFESISAKELFKLVKTFALGLIEIGIKRSEHIGIISDNRKKWIIADFAILSIGCADVPRGSDSTEDEIKYILRHAECITTLAENEAQLNKIISIKKFLPKLKTIIVIDSEYTTPKTKLKGINVYSFSEIERMGENSKKEPDYFEKEIEKGETTDLATLIYTSGTTGEPKGVMLNHSNFMHQIKAPHTPLEFIKGDVVLSVLPVWHAFERTVEYVILFSGCTLVYSKPIAKVMIQDMGEVKPAIFPSVPRIWERIRSAIYKKVKAEGGLKFGIFRFFVMVGSAHAQLKSMIKGLLPQFKRRIRIMDILISIIPLILLTPLKLLGNLLVFGKIKKRLGGKSKFGVSGAGALPPYIDNFFAAAGICLLEGYGLTEAAPIVSVRNFKKPVSRTIGQPLPGIDIKILDENSKELPYGMKGVLHVKGPNVMMGYYKKPEETSYVLSDDGWLNTGDLAMVTYKGEIRIMGREKETIVLMGGENIEPGPIEDTILQSDYIDQVMIVGQDQKFLAALIIPSIDNINTYIKDSGLKGLDSPDKIADSSDISNFMMGEINSRINTKKGFKVFELINRIKLIAKPFEIGKEMTHTLKLKKSLILEKYKKEISEIFEK